MDGYIRVPDLAQKWGVTVRQVQVLCKTGKIKGAIKFGNVWAIPDDTQKPTRTGKTKPGRKSESVNYFSAQ